METFNRICVEDYAVKAENGDVLELQRGKEYITSAERDGMVTVFSTYWAKVPVEIFAGAVPFTTDTIVEESPSKLVQLLDNLTGRPNAMRELAIEVKEELDQIIDMVEWFADIKNYETYSSFEAHGVLHMGPSYIEGEGIDRALDILELITGMKRERKECELTWYDNT